ncbi:ESYT3, partial [Symbiodinium pilosum]
LDPHWKFDCEMASMKTSDTLEFQVFDYDAIGSDDLLGTLELTFDQFYPGGADDTFELVDPARRDGKVATIKLKVFPEPIQFPIRDTRCWVTVHRAEGLRAADWSLLGNGKSDPYCIVSIPHKKHSTWRTRILYKELNPSWDEEEEMINYEPGDNLKFQVMDYDKKDDDDHLGQALLQSGDFHPDGFEGLSPALRLVKSAWVKARCMYGSTSSCLRRTRTCTTRLTM